MKAYYFVICAVLFLAASLFGSDIVRAQQPNPSPTPVPNVEQRMDQLNKKVDEIAESVKRLHAEPSEYMIFLEYKGIFKFMAWFFGVGGAILALTFGYIQIRKADIQAKMQDEYIRKGEQTLSLINAILALVHQSTAQTMLSATIRAERELSELTRAINSLMTFSNRDNRDVIATRDKYDELRELFNDLTVFEFANRNLASPLALTPACMFLKALNHAQEHRSDAAIELWRDTYSTANVSPAIQIRSWYWIGHEQVNLGRFAAAEESFETAAALARGANAPSERVLELERLSIEARLYRLEGKGAETLLARADALINECDSKNLSDVRSTAMRTRGNILYSVSYNAFESGNREKAIESMRAAKELWKHMVEGEMNFAERRELVFACFALQEDFEVAQDLLGQKVREEARRLYINCIGHRDKAYYAMIQLMIAKAQNAEERAQSMDTRANFHVAEMHESEWPYSALRKRPVSRHDFQEDIRLISERGLPVLV